MNSTATEPSLSLRDHLLSILLLALLTIYYLFPFFTHPSGYNGSGDDAVFANAFWWFKKSVADFKNPFFSDYLFFPNGMSLVFHASTFSNFLLVFPLQLIFGVNTAVNAAYVLTYVLTGYFTFLLVFELTSSRSAAIVSALIFAFTPFHFGHGRAHLHMATLQWLPLYFLFLKRALSEFRAQQAIYAGAAFGMILLTDQLQTICAAMVTMGALSAAAFSVSHREQLVKSVRQAAITAAVAATVASVYIFPLLKELFSHRAATKVAPLEHGGANMFSADLLGFFIPGFHRVWGGLFASFSLGRDSTVYIGFITMLLAGYGAWHHRHVRYVRWSVATAALFFVMSLGTYLHINGTWEFGQLRIPMPYLAMTNIPLIGENRTPCRFHLMTMLAMAILAGYGVKELITRNKWGAMYPKVAVTLIAALILLETLPPEQQPGAAQIPAIYKTMAHDRTQYSVLQLPLARWSAIYKNGSGNPSAMMYYQTIHGKPVFGGLASRLVPDDLDFRDNLLDLLRDISSYDNLLAQNYSMPTVQEYAAAKQQGTMLAPFRDTFLKRYGIGYIVLHPPINGPTLSRTFLEAFMGRSFTRDKNDGIAYIKTN